MSLATLLADNTPDTLLADLPVSADLSFDLESPTTFQDVSLDIDQQHFDAMQSVETDPDAKKTFQQLVAAQGFVFEQHPVVTKDGYKLSLFRIKKQDMPAGSKVVFF